MNQREYYIEVHSIAEGIIEEAQDEGELDRESVDNRLWQTIDSHQWVIYTHYNHEILRHSANDDYAVEHFGVETALQDGAINWAALAFGALYADVSEVLWPLFEEAVAEAEEAAEEVKP